MMIINIFVINKYMKVNNLYTCTIQKKGEEIELCLDHPDIDTMKDEAEIDIGKIHGYLMSYMKYLSGLNLPVDTILSMMAREVPFISLNEEKPTFSLTKERILYEIHNSDLSDVVILALRDLVERRYNLHQE